MSNDALEQAARELAAAREHYIACDLLCDEADAARHAAGEAQRAAVKKFNRLTQEVVKKYESKETTPA